MLMLILNLLLIIVIFIFYNKLNKINNKEHYDARISNTLNIEKCANMCSSVFGCGSFSFNQNLQKCYLSKFPITSPPLPAVFSSEYVPENTYCNKMLPIISDYSINNDMYVDNKIYDCYNNKAEYLGKKYYDFSKKEQPIMFNDIYSLKSYDYTLQYLNWPSNKVDTQFDDKLNILYEENQIMYDGDYINEHNGEYLNPGMCKTDMSVTECLKTCTGNSSCEGVEFNPSFKKYKNVCCPKTKIKEIIKRRPNAEHGIYYGKRVNFINNNKNNVLL